MKLLTGPTGWIWSETFCEAQWHYKGVVRFRVSGVLLFQRPTNSTPTWVKRLYKELKKKDANFLL